MIQEETPLPGPCHQGGCSCVHSLATKGGNHLSDGDDREEEEDSDKEEGEPEEEDNLSEKDDRPRE